MKRLDVQPGERIDRARPLAFSFDGQAVEGFEGDTIVSALLASGRTVLSRSFKYHRPRGELCGSGQCAGSLFQIDGSPGVRGCGEPAVAGMRVEHQNAWPSLDFDVMRITDRLGGPLTPVGFYYKTFLRPRRMWPLYEKALRRAAGLGRLPVRQDERAWRTEYRRRHCDVLVVGGGVAGLAAALRAAELGADVVLCDDDVEPGGALLVSPDREHARALAARARAAGVEILSRAGALGYFDGLVPVWQGDTLHQVRAGRHIAATGTIEQPLVFADNDRPGIMLAGGAQRLAALYAVAPGRTAVVATVGDDGLEAALALLDAGVAVAAVADLRPDAHERPAAERLAGAGVRVQAGATVVRSLGRTGVERAVIARLDGAGRAVDGSEQEIDCDVLAVSGGRVPASSLLLQAGARATYDATTASFMAVDLPAGVHAAGSVAGYEDAAAAELSGGLAGSEAALVLGLGTAADERRTAEDRARLGARGAPPRRVAAPAWARGSSPRGGKAFVDLDEDVTVKDVEQAVDEGYDSIELAKRYTTATMGPSQGRFSQLAAVRVVAAKTGLRLDQVGLTTARPPWSTVPLGALAGRPFEPAKRSALHGAHRARNATITWAGDWRRAYDYGDPEGEALTVQETAGLIDVSSLGKLIVRGPDASEFLDRMYPNRMANLARGRIRYGVLLSEAGRITDDGTVARLDAETFYVTTTSTGVTATEQSFTSWLATWELDVHVSDVTHGVAAMNLAGPRAREILSRLTDLECSNDAFAYLDARHGQVARIACLLLRIGFVGETGYEIHCAAPHARTLWDALLDAGADIGVRPFGLEPQRILRLQKQHLLIGQDTDSESTPSSVAMSWVVKLDKEQDFVGRWALEQHARRADATTLVGFTVPSGDVPTEGAVVLHAGRPAGQVTSARRSPRLAAVIGLATVPSAIAAETARITISDAGRLIDAVVTTRPFYDPEGEALRG